MQGLQQVGILDIRVMRSEWLLGGGVGSEAVGKVEVCDTTTLARSAKIKVGRSYILRWWMLR
jgi:hypothetical protein